MGLGRLYVAARLTVTPAIDAPECARWWRTVWSGCGCTSARCGWAVAPSRLAAGCRPGAPAGAGPCGGPSSCSLCLPVRRCRGAVRRHRRRCASTSLPSTRGIGYSRAPFPCYLTKPSNAAMSYRSPLRIPRPGVALTGLCPRGQELSVRGLPDDGPPPPKLFSAFCRLDVLAVRKQYLSLKDIFL